MTQDTFIFLAEPSGLDTDLTSLPTAVVKLYDLFTWQHHYAAKDNENEGPREYCIIM